MKSEDFDYIRRLVLDRSCLVLDPGKEYLVETRLAPLVRDFQLKSIGDLINRMRHDPGRDLERQIIEAMVTTETFFFRDTQVFEALRTSVIPDLIEKRKSVRRLSIWSAACSSGQEPYSLAMMIQDHFPILAGWDVDLLATDLSEEMLDRARTGRYNQIEVQRGLQPDQLARHFEKEGAAWRVQARIRQQVVFRSMNLGTTWPLLPSKDLVLLRNVMIYFDVPTKKSILGKVGGVLRPDGYLLLGSAESTFNLDAAYQRVEHAKAGFYQLRPV